MPYIITRSHLAFMEGESQVSGIMSFEYGSYSVTLHLDIFTPSCGNSLMATFFLQGDFDCTSRRTVAQLRCRALCVVHLLFRCQNI
jgi:hypothetical protein